MTTASRVALFDEAERPILCQQCGQARLWQYDEDAGFYVCLHGQSPGLRLRIGVALPEMVRRTVEDAPMEFEEAP